MKRLVRTSAGHAQVLRDRALAPFPDLERIVVRSHALTADLATGPGWLAGTYRPKQEGAGLQMAFSVSNRPISQAGYAQSAINSVAKILYFLYSLVARQTGCALGAAARPHRTQRKRLVLLATAQHDGVMASRGILRAGGTWNGRCKDRTNRRFTARFAMPSTSSTALESDTP